MPDIYVMNDWISQALVVWLIGVAILAIPILIFDAFKRVRSKK